MELLFVILFVIISLVLVFLVVIQNSKGGGLVSNVQSANVASQLLGVRRAGDVVEKATWVVIGSLGALAIITNLYFISARSGNTQQSPIKMKSLIENQKVETPPATQTPGATPAAQPTEKK